MRLEARDISAGYGSKDVLESVGVVVNSGEFVGLIGPNGCGKSTLLRVLTGVLPARKGRVALEERPLAAWSRLEIARRVAFVPQQEEAAFDFTVRDIVLMGRHPYHERFRGVSAEDYACVARALAETDILHLADRPITRLSGGEFRRVLVARALAQQAPLLLLDEPTAHLDVTHQVALLALTQRLTRERDVGALAALHDLNHAAEFCDRLVLMADGRVHAEGEPGEVLTPANLRAVYDAQAQVGRNPATGRPLLLSLRPARDEGLQPDAPRVHVVCGGGSGVGVMGALVRNGFHISAGVLNRLDSDQEAAEALGIEVVLEAPFSKIGPDARAACAALLQTASTIIVTSVPFGNGNLANLELVAEAQAAGKTVVLLGETPISTRDYAGGAATELFLRLQANGALQFDRIEEWPDLVAGTSSGAEADPSLNPARAESALPARL